MSVGPFSSTQLNPTHRKVKTLNPQTNPTHNLTELHTPTTNLRHKEDNFRHIISQKYYVTGLEMQRAANAQNVQFHTDYKRNV